MLKEENIFAAMHDTLFEKFFDYEHLMQEIGIEVVRSEMRQDHWTYEVFTGHGFNLAFYVDTQSMTHESHWSVRVSQIDRVNGHAVFLEHLRWPGYPTKGISCQWPKNDDSYNFNAEGSLYVPFGEFLIFLKEFEQGRSQRGS